MTPVLLAALASAHDVGTDRPIEFPDVGDRVTLACDLHMHTSFSDGSVWPDIRVREAERDAIDCIAITEHLEHQPNAQDIPHKDRNRAFEIASAVAEGSDLIVVPGSEITRDMPPGHANALFLSDVNKLKKKKVMDAWQAAMDQGAFVFWNHPNWERHRPDGIARLDPMHTELIAKGWIQGIEVVNDVTYSDEALQIALDHDLAILGTSDIHGLVDWRYNVPRGGHRPVTLIFADERSQAGLKSALEARRTVAWFENTLIGRPDQLEPLIAASLTVTDARYMPGTTLLVVQIENGSDARFLLRNEGAFTFHDSADLVTVEPHTTTKIRIKTVDEVTSVEVPFEVMNAVTAPGQHARWTMRATVEE